jgi:hypothetical protein
MTTNMGDGFDGAFEGDIGQMQSITTCSLPWTELVELGWAVVMGWLAAAGGVSMFGVMGEEFWLVTSAGDGPPTIVSEGAGSGESLDTGSVWMCASKYSGDTPKGSHMANDEAPETVHIEAW